MKHIVGFSGGAASAYVAKLAINEFGKENVILLHHDTKAEDPDTYRFIDQVSNYLDKEITEVSDGRSLWEVIADNHCLPSFHIPFCTRDLKLKPAEMFYKTLKGQEFITYNGFGPDEWKRVAKAVPRSELEGRKLRCLLYERNISNEIVKKTIMNEWKICLPNAYKYLSHNNCIPCFKAGKPHFYKVWLYYPERFQKAIEMEELIGYQVFHDNSLSELGNMWQQGKAENLFDDNAGVPCMCAE